MADDISLALRFDHTAAPDRFLGTALIADLEGFTEYCNTAHCHTHLAEFLNLVFRDIGESISHQGSGTSAQAFTIDNLAPEHVKFLGDGVLAIWRLPQEAFQAQRFHAKLINLAHLARLRYDDLREDLIDEWGEPNLPTRLRFGIASGEIIRLICAVSAFNEYVGVPINLAARLQSVCRPLGFTVSARASLLPDFCEDFDFVRASIGNLRGFFHEEHVLIDKFDFENLTADCRSVFKLLP